MHGVVDIIVIGFGLDKIEIDCLKSIIKNTAHPYVLTYYDNKKNKYTLTELWNMFIAKSSCEYICLLNNDTEVSPYWLTKLIETFSIREHCGFVGPSTDNCHSPQSTVQTFEEAEKHKNVVRVLEDPISGFCVAFKRELFEKLGGFDCRYKHYGQESDLINRGQRQGYEACWRVDAFVHHIGEASVGPAKIDVEAARKEARAIYWSSRK